MAKDRMDRPMDADEDLSRRSEEEIRRSEEGITGRAEDEDEDFEDLEEDEDEDQDLEA
jgi:hypothetical protein